MLVLPMHAVNAHMLELEIIDGEDSTSKAKLLEFVATVRAVQLQYVNVHWLEFKIFAGE